MTEIRRQTDPPWSVAFAQAVMSIRVRLFRQGAAALGVLLGVAFYVSVGTSRALSPPDPAVPASLEAANRLEWLVFLSLLMCLVGISNAMLMSVTERYKEIGTLKCLGATDGFIVKVFFLEALLIGAASSLLGALIGVGLMSLVRGVTEGFGSFSPGFAAAWPGLVGLGTLIGVVLTSLAAIFPAMQAARMPAAAALRVEV